MAIVPCACIFFTSFACVLEYKRVLSICNHFLVCCVSVLVGANNRMWIPFGIAPSGNECRLVHLTFLTDWYLWVLSLGYFLFCLLSRVFQLQTD